MTLAGAADDASISTVNTADYTEAELNYYNNTGVLPNTDSFTDEKKTILQNITENGSFKEVIQKYGVETIENISAKLEI